MSKRKKRVDISIRVRRRDGKPMTRREAVKVMGHVRRHSGSAPAAYIVTGVEWSRPGKQTAHGSLGDLQGSALANVLNAVSDDPEAWDLKVGAVKSDGEIFDEENGDGDDDE